MSESQNKFQDIIEKIEKLSVLELHELVKTLEEKFEAELSITSQQEEAINKRKDEFIALQVLYGEIHYIYSTLC